MARQPAATGEDNAILVNEHEGAVLGLISRSQPLTRYQLYKAFQQSPTTTYNTSKGSLYPLVTRLIERGLVGVEENKSRRDAELLSLTRSGYAALTRWIEQTGPQHSFINDPMLLRVMALSDVSREERIRWIADAKGLLLDRKHQLLDYEESAASPYDDIVHGTAIAILDAKLEWLDRLLIKVVNEPPQG
jgi:DNA-binding PadR family transcriptional regulator